MTVSCAHDGRATVGVPGGIAQHTSDVVLLCEAAGFEIVIVETVGLGQVRAVAVAPLP